MPLEFALGLSVLFALVGAECIALSVRISKLEKVVKALCGRVVTPQEEKQGGPDGASPKG